MKIYKTSIARLLKGLCMFSCLSLLANGQMEENPNILLIMTDQQAWDAVG